jgi:hypothetical protein
MRAGEAHHQRPQLDDAAAEGHEVASCQRRLLRGGELRETQTKVGQRDATAFANQRIQREPEQLADESQQRQRQPVQQPHQSEDEAGHV